MTTGFTTGRTKRLATVAARTAGAACTRPLRSSECDVPRRKRRSGYNSARGRTGAASSGEHAKLLSRNRKPQARVDWHLPGATTARCGRAHTVVHQQRVHYNDAAHGNCALMSAGVRSYGWEANSGGVARTREDGLGPGPSADQQLEKI